MNLLKMPIVFIDLFALLVMFLYIQLCFAFLLINPSQEEKPTSKPRAEMIVSNNWQEICEDVDLWIRRVGGEVVGYLNREQGPFKLHGDHTTENYGMIDGEQLKEASEVITIHKMVPGTYQVSIHGYRISRNEEVTVTTEVEIIDPFNKICNIERVIRSGEEVPICEFTINSDGEITEPTVTKPHMLSKFLHLGGSQ